MRIFDNQLLGINSAQTELFFEHTLEELQRTGEEKTRLCVFNRYANALKLLHLTQDPFEAVTGVTLEKAYLTKYATIPMTFARRIMLADTAFIDERFFSESLGIEEALSDADKGLTINGRLPSGSVAFRAQFQPVTLGTFSNKPSWKAKFIPVDFTTSDKKVFLTKGIIILEHEPLVKLARTKHFSSIYSILTTLASLFNHDLTSHGTMDIHNPTSCEHIASLSAELVSGKTEFEEFSMASRKLLGGEKTVRQVIALEVGMLSLHLNLCLEAAACNPALLRWVIITFHRYLRIMKEAERLIGQPSFDYFMRLFMYLLTRILPLSAIRRGDVFQSSSGLSSARFTYMSHLNFFLDTNRFDIDMVRAANMSGFPVYDLEEAPADWSLIKRIPHDEVYKRAYVENMGRFERGEVRYKQSH